MGHKVDQTLDIQDLQYFYVLVLPMISKICNIILCHNFMLCQNLYDIQNSQNFRYPDLPVATIFSHKVEFQNGSLRFWSLLNTTFKICNSYNGHFKYILMYCRAKLDLCITQRSLKVHVYTKGRFYRLQKTQILQKKRNLISHSKKQYVLRNKEQLLDDNTTSSYRIQV